jgi:DNA primase
MPLEWDELDATASARAFDLRSARARADTWKRDPLRDILSQQPDLPRALAALANSL